MEIWAVVIQHDLSALLADNWFRCKNHIAVLETAQCDWNSPELFVSFHVNEYCNVSAVECPGMGGSRGKYLGGEGKAKSWRPSTFFRRHPQNTGQNYQINHSNRPKNSPLYNCFQVLLLHTAAVANDLGGKAQVWGGQLSPAPT